MFVCDLGVYDKGENLYSLHLYSQNSTHTLYIDTKVVDFFTYTLGSAAYYNLAFIAVTAVAIGFATAGNAKVIWDALSSFIIEMELQQASTSEGVISDAHDVRISALSSEESSSLTAEQGNSSKSMRWPSSPSSNGGRSGAYSV